MVKVYGRDDDLVIIEGSKYEFEEIGAYNSDVIVRFTDGAVVRFEYDGGWCLVVEALGPEAVGSGPDPSKGYAYVFSTDAEVKSHEVIDRRL